VPAHSFIDGSLIDAALLRLSPCFRRFFLPLGFRPRRQLSFQRFTITD
jgi:hypothetical protein